MTAGYSSTPLAKKLGIKAGGTVSVVKRNKGWEIPELPEGVVVQYSAKTSDVIVWFVRDKAEISAALTTAAPLIFPAASVWIAWPRKAGGHVSNVTENDIRNTALAMKLVDVKVAAIDHDWSGLKIVWRKEHR